MVSGLADWPVGAVHPRVCGEHPSTCLARLRQVGSSPRVRGTSPYLPAHLTSRRFIPACAGNMKCPEFAHSLVSVHPRVCGEHMRGLMLRYDQFGSSPRVRGTSWRIYLEGLRERFIPACAGNIRRTSSLLVFILRFIPACAGNIHQSVAGVSRRCGSSPRVRGTFVTVGASAMGRRHGSSPRVRGTY